MHTTSTPIPGVKLIEEIRVLGDDRGSFRTWWRTDWDNEAASLKVQQLNISENLVQGTTRGSHIAPWNKYIHCFYGHAFAVIIDARRNSPAFGRVESFTLNESNALLVPGGCGNAYQAIDNLLVYGYAVDELWFRSDQETTVSLFDQRFDQVPWPIEDRSKWIVSDKDRTSPRFDDVFQL
jgi:dTDP-4-dehydrorhamnose 3,5-epimerase